MRINSISNHTPCSFGSFKIVDYGAQALAEEFVKNPELEAKFMLNVAKPLESSDGEVVYDGNNVYYKHPQESRGGSIVYEAGNDRNILAVVAENYSRNGYRKLTEVRPTNVFRNHYPLNEIEAAKNIILDKDCFYNKIAAAKYAEAHKNETIEEKTARLKKRFGINA